MEYLSPIDNCTPPASAAAASRLHDDEQPESINCQRQRRPGNRLAIPLLLHFRIRASSDV